MGLIIPLCIADEIIARVRLVVPTDHEEFLASQRRPGGVSYGFKLRCASILPPPADDTGLRAPKLISLFNGTRNDAVPKLVALKLIYYCFQNGPRSGSHSHRTAARSERASNCAFRPQIPVK